LKLWSTYFNTLFKEFKGFSESVNKKLPSYHARKGANQALSEIPTVSRLAHMFRTGWEVRGFHSVFHYVIGSAVLINQAGKAVSGWTTKRDNEIVGGSPPVLHDIVTAADNVDSFVTALFSDDYCWKWRRSVRGLLIASLLRFYDDFIDIILDHPSRTFERIDQHPFVFKVNEAKRLACIDETTWKSWCKEVQQGFVQRNLPALPIELIPRNNGNFLDNLRFDPRCFVDHFISMLSPLLTTVYIRNI
jgi:hypothetical protein